MRTSPSWTVTPSCRRSTTEPTWRTLWCEYLEPFFLTGEREREFVQHLIFLSRENIHTGKQRTTRREQMEPGPILKHVAWLLHVACSVYRTVVTTGFAHPNLFPFSRRVQCGWERKYKMFSHRCTHTHVQNQVRSNPHWMQVRKFALKSFDAAYIWSEHFREQQQVPSACFCHLRVQCGLGQKVAREWTSAHKEQDDFNGSVFCVFLGKYCTLG